MSVAKWTFAAGLLLLLGGCASVDPTPDYDQAEREVVAATGADALYHPGEEEEARERVEQLLLDGLTPQEVAQIALLNNRGLQGLLLEIGMSRADAVQAGLLSNPSLEALVRLPVDSGSTTTEGGLIQNLIELWSLPARERLAESRTEQKVLEVAHRAVILAAQAKSAYYAAVASSSAASVAEENLATARGFLELTLERQEAGAATQVDVNAARSTFLEQQVIVRESEFAAYDSKRRLALVLGLGTPPEQLVLLGPFTEPPVFTADLARLLAMAEVHRLDLRAVEKEVEAAENALALERRLLLREGRGGLAFESEGGDLAIGPAVELELPIFDQNQAQIAKAEYRHAQATRRLEGLSASVAQQVRGAYERFSAARDTARLFRTELLPLREASLELARESFAAGKTGFLSVLEAQDRLLAARREYVSRLESVLTGLADLEAACGRPVDLLFEAAESSERGGG